MKNETLKPGQKAPQSGQYEIVEPSTIKTGHQFFEPPAKRTGIERTVTKGEPLPPTEKPGQVYILVDPTKHPKK